MTSDEVRQELEDEFNAMPEGPEKNRVRRIKEMCEKVAKEEGLDKVKYTLRKVDETKDGRPVYTIE